MPFVSSPPGSSRVISASGGDDYATAQAAINASIVDGKTIVVRGILRLSAGLIIENAVNGITMMGATGGSGFIPYDAAADAITLLTERVTAGNGGYHTVIQDLLFKSRKAHSAPGADSGGTIGFVTSSSWGTHIRNCAFFYCKTAIICSNSYGGAADANGNQVTAIERIKIFGPHIDSGPAIWLKGSTEVTINNVLAFCGAGTPPVGSIALLIESRDSINVNHFGAVCYEIGTKIRMANTTLNINGGIWFWNAMMDTGGTGFVIDGTGDNVDEIEFHGCWAGYNSGTGVIVKGSNLKGVRWYGGIVQANGGGGFDIQSGDASDAQHTISGCQILDNQTYGIQIASGVGGIRIHDNKFHDNVNYGVGFNTQSHGIKFLGSHQGLNIHDNDMVGNVTGATTGDYTHSSNVVHHNRGLNPKGVLGPPAVPASTTAYTNAYAHDCTVYVSGGTVSAIAVGGTSTGATSGAFRVAAGQTITLTYSVAPTWTWFGD
jgi:hypothetical protein